MILQKHIDLLEARGITGEIASRLGWHSLDRNDGEWIGIPFINKGKQVGVKYRTIAGEKKFYQAKGSEQCLYNIDQISEISEFPLIITEGEMDCAIALQCGYSSVSVPNGAPSKSIEEDGKKYDYLGDIPKNIEIILVFDDDEPGHNLLHDVSIRLGKERCKWIKYPKDCKDLNDTFAKYGQRGVDETLKRAQWMKIDGLYRMSELPPVPTLIPIPCPISGLGDHYKLRLGDFTVITGIPGYGKTTLANEIGSSMALKYGWNAVYASFEQNPKQDHQRSLRSYHAKKPENCMTEQEISEADKWIEDKFSFISPNIDDDVSLKWVLEKCRAAILRNNAKLVVIDPWNEMDHDFPPELTLTRYTGFAIKQFKKLAQKYMVHVIVIAHPAKLQKNKDGFYNVPTLYDISDSANWNNKCDIGIVIHNNDDLTTTVRLAKVRYLNLIGKRGDVILKYDDYRNCYSLPGEVA